ncbi:hypothetical protein C1Y40_05764 [Mycobacterium talmoniae]|uniref:Uncharacterized protein n=1 Tax=Mycobacterium talmoniae TaxID=1858794 RepID=A0A2S8BBP1_9MYCO|nr:hypothetical protein C1Y40_05764 [Mycobacterium talmoniae]
MRCSAQEFVAGRIIGRQRALQLAQVAAEGLQQRVPGAMPAVVGDAGHRAVAVLQRPPQRIGGVRQPQVQLVVGGQRLQQLDVGAGQPGVPE